MWELDIKKAEWWRIDGFEVWCCRRLSRAPWTTRRSNQVLSIHWSTDAEAEVPIFWLPDTKNWLIRKDPDAGKGGKGDDRGWDGWMASPTWWTWVWANFRSWWWTGKPGVLQSMGSQRVRHNWATELNWGFYYKLLFFFLYFKVKSLISNIIIIKDQSKRVGIDWEFDIDLYTLLYLK